MTARSSVAGSVGYTYDAAERLITLDDSVAGEFGLSYNAYNGLVENLEYPNGIDCSFQYDIMDRLIGISYTLGGSTVESVDYGYNDATGMITNRTRECILGDSSTGYGYDSLDRLTAETLRNATGGVVDASTFNYDLAGNRTGKTRNDITVDYDLGTGNRLASWDITSTGTLETVLSVGGHSSEAVGLDPRFGERTINDLEADADTTNFWHLAVPVSTGSVDIVAAIGDEAGNVSLVTNEITVTIITNAAYAYDSAGNLTNVLHNGGAVSNVLSWNEQYQLVSFSTNGGVAESYTYDALGRRLTTTQGSDTMVHMYSGIHCIADTDTNGVPLRTYTYGPGVDNPLAMTVHESSETNTYYYLTDHLGSVLGLTDDSGEVVESYDYDAWGRVSVFDAGGTPLDESAFDNRITFQGREHSWATGLTYFRARWYDPVTGRWLSKDPIGISGGLNQYVAFGNNPVAYRDPFGLEAGDEYSSAKDAVTAALTDVFNLTKYGHKYGQRKVNENWVKRYGWPYKYPKGRIPPGFEWGGAVYRLANGKYSYTPPLSLCRQEAAPATSDGTPEGANVIAFYHSHPGQWLQDMDGNWNYGPLNGNEHHNWISSSREGDKGLADVTGKLIGMAAPNGNLVEYDPRVSGFPAHGRVFGKVGE